MAQNNKAAGTIEIDYRVGFIEATQSIPTPKNFQLDKYIRDRVIFVFDHFFLYFVSLFFARLCFMLIAIESNSLTNEWNI